MGCDFEPEPHGVDETRFDADSSAGSDMGEIAVRMNMRGRELPSVRAWAEMMNCTPDGGHFSAAWLSPCESYRYLLVRSWNQARPLLGWVMLNPSTADESTDDPTVKKCIGFAQRRGCGGIVVANVFAFRATSPKELARHHRDGGDIAGPGNEGVVDLMFRLCGPRVIVAWGAHSLAAEAGPKLIGDRPVTCLGTTKSGAPKHPLYLRYETEEESWK